MAQELGIKHMRQGEKAVGTPVGAPLFVHNKLRQKAE